MSNSPTEQARRELDGLLSSIRNVYEGHRLRLNWDVVAYRRLTSSLIAWHLRHSSQPEAKMGDVARELGRSARKQIDAVGELGKLFDRYEGAPTISALMNWHNAHAPQTPTRQQVQDFVADVLRPEKYLSESIDKFMALFSQGSGKRECPACHQEIKDDLHSV